MLAFSRFGVFQLVIESDPSRLVKVCLSLSSPPMLIRGNWSAVVDNHSNMGQSCTLPNHSRNVAIISEMSDT